MKKCILLVDDDRQIRESLRKVLQAEGYKVLLAADGREAVEEIHGALIDLVLLDLNLPFISGWDTFGRFTSFNPFIPIVIITGRQNQHELAVAAGISALMEKPLDVPQLLLTISELLAEDAEAHLKRMMGLRDDMRYAPRLPAVSTDGLEPKQSVLRRGRFPSAHSVRRTVGQTNA